MQNTCKFCKQIKPVTRMHRKERIYCSRACYNLDHHTTTCCKVCNKEFMHHSTKTRHFCSISCSNRNRHPVSHTSCAFCRKIFVAKNWRKASIFCSKVCFNKSGIRSLKKLREKNPNFTDGKFSYRRYAFRELPNYCANCKSEKKLDAHHIDSDRKNNDLSNLIILCHSCHMKYHHGTIEYCSSDPD